MLFIVLHSTLQVLMGLFKLDFITILLSDSLVSGHTAAAAFTIMITQIKFLFGLPRALAAIPSGPFVTPKVSAIHDVGYSIAYYGMYGIVCSCVK